MSEQKATPVAFRFQPATKEALRVIAERESRSMANMVEWLVREYCGREGLGWPLAVAPEKHAKKTKSRA